MKWLPLILAAMLLPGCDQLVEPSGKSSKLDDAQYRAALESRGVGRFMLVPGAGAYPPLWLDTVTGCVQQIKINPADGTIQKLPINTSDAACLGKRPRDPEREQIEGGKTK